MAGLSISTNLINIRLHKHAKSTLSFQVILNCISPSWQRERTITDESQMSNRYHMEKGIEREQNL